MRFPRSDSVAAWASGRGPAFVLPIGIGDACTACGACLATCGPRALTPAPVRPSFWPQRCTGCLECVEVCPRDAVLLCGDGGIPRPMATKARP
ncbi:MAG: DUF362 domain-containing protein [Acidimicrobiales bacterium]